MKTRLLGALVALAISLVLPAFAQQKETGRPYGRWIWRPANPGLIDDTLDKRKTLYGQRRHGKTLLATDALSGDLSYL